MDEQKIKKATQLFQEHAKSSESYVVAAEKMSVDDKLQILNEMGKPELIDLFKEWKPRTTRRKKRSAPLDQRVSITVTDQERFSLDAELKQMKKEGSKISMSQFVRHRAIGTININEWKPIAEEALSDLDEIEKNKKSLEEEVKALTIAVEEEEDEEVEEQIYLKISKIKSRLAKLVGSSNKRKNRLSGRMSMAEAETIKWRASKLCLSTSDYLRMLIFALEPNTSADSHMSLDSKRRFYISILDVAENGWGSPPELYECSQCSNYLEEIRKLKEENRQLRALT